MTKKFLLAALVFISMADFVQAQGGDPYMLKRKRMVETQMVRRGISDEKVLNALLKVKRHEFVNPGSQSYAYDDTPLSIGYGQTISQPYIVAYMTEVARLNKDDKVLEIGTGSGYQAAILAEIVKQVYTIEILEPLAKTAQERLERLGYTNVFVKHGDGYKGWKEHAPFDAIIVTAAPTEVPEKLVDQLKVGGRMVIPIGSFFQELYVITKTEKGYDQKSVLPVRFVPMVKDKE